MDLIPAEETRVEIRVVNSRFIATIAPASDVEEARAFIQRIKREFADATHNVPAYVIGHGPSVVAHCNDDGEPAGTAGRPVLAVLQGSGLGDAVLVVTRYFGGTKLGTGGLVRAYGDAARAVIGEVRRAQIVPSHQVRVEVPYGLYEQVKLLIAAHQGRIEDESFAAEVVISVLFAVEQYGSFQSGMRELSHGRIEPVIVGITKTIIPLKSGDGEVDHQHRTS